MNSPDSTYDQPEADGISAGGSLSDAVKFLSGIFGLENLKDYIGEIAFFKELPSMLETLSHGSACFLSSNISALADGLPARPATPWWTHIIPGMVRNLHNELVVPPLVEKCKAFYPLADPDLYCTARERALREVKSISQTLGVELLRQICTVIPDASVHEMHGMQVTIHARRVDVHSTLQDIMALQRKLDGTEDDDERRALEEDVTGQILWLSLYGTISEVKQRLPEVSNYIEREGDSTTRESHDYLLWGLHEIGKIIEKAFQPQLDDNLAHLQRIILDAGARVSKHQLWLAARAAEQDKWSCIPAPGTSPYYSNNFGRVHIHRPANSGH